MVRVSPSHPSLTPAPLTPPPPCPLKDREAGRVSVVVPQFPVMPPAPPQPPPPPCRMPHSLLRVAILRVAILRVVMWRVVMWRVVPV